MVHFRTSPNTGTRAVFKRCNSWVTGKLSPIVKSFEPDIAGHIGEYERGANNISTTATRFATTGEVLDGSKGGKDGVRDEGSQNGAFRHVLWQAAIASKFGSLIAKEVGDAHEENPNATTGIGIVKGRANADERVDLSNNIIGRKIAEENPNMSMKDLAVLVLETFKKDGLYTAMKLESSGNFLILKTKLSDDQYQILNDLIKNLNNEGRTEEQQKARDAFWKKESERLDKQLKASGRI